MDKKDFDTTGTGPVLTDPYKDNYYDLIVAIYKQAIKDAMCKDVAYADNAKTFLKKNPYGLAVDFDGIIKKLRGGENEKN